MDELMLDAESHSDGKHVAVTVEAKKGALDVELRLDVELEDAKRFYRELGEAIARTEEKQ